MYIHVSCVARIAHRTARENLYVPLNLYILHARTYIPDALLVELYVPHLRVTYREFPKFLAR